MVYRLAVPNNKSTGTAAEPVDKGNRPELGYFNPHRTDRYNQLGREQGHRLIEEGERAPDGTFRGIDLHNLYGPHYMSSPNTARLLKRLHLDIRHTATHWEVWKNEDLANSTPSNPRTPIYTTTVDDDLFGKNILNWLTQEYVPHLLATGTVPAPPPTFTPRQSKRSPEYKAKRKADAEARKALKISLGLKRHDPLPPEHRKRRGPKPADERLDDILFNATKRYWDKHPEEYAQAIEDHRIDEQTKRAIEEIRERRKQT